MSLESGVVAILRADSPEHLLPVAQTLCDEGLSSLELTLTTPGALEQLPLLGKEFPGIGMGSVLGADDARRCVDAGAAFLVSPVLDLDVVRVGVESGVPVYPAGQTATELLAGWNAGACAVKLFPASTVGPGHLKAIREPLPQLKIMATGGIGLDDIGAWIRAGAVAVGLGGSLTGDALRGGDLKALAGRARRALDQVAAAR